MVQVLVTWAERAATSVGMEPQSWLECNFRPCVRFMRPISDGISPLNERPWAKNQVSNPVSRPSSVGIVPEYALDIKYKSLLNAVSFPSSVGTMPLILYGFGWKFEVNPVIRPI